MPVFNGEEKYFKCVERKSFLGQPVLHVRYSTVTLYGILYEEGKGNISNLPGYRHFSFDPKLGLQFRQVGPDFSNDLYSRVAMHNNPDLSCMTHGNGNARMSFLIRCCLQHNTTASRFSAMP